MDNIKAIIFDMGGVLIDLDIEAYKIPLLKELSQRYDLYLLSNNNPISWKRCMELFEESGLPVDSIFKQSFLSYEMKKLKPAKEIFMEIISAIPEYSPEEMLFIDDSAKNTETASKCGLEILHFPQTNNLREDLEKCGRIYTHDGTPRIAYQYCR